MIFMKKTVSLLMGLLLAFGSGAALVGCGKKGGGENCLTIRYYKGGYGDEWLKDSVNNFLTEKLGRTPEKDKDYKLIPDTAVTANQANYLKGNNVPDILMTQGGYEQYVEEGLIENLTDVYDTEVEKLDGSKVKIKDYMLPEAYQSVTRQMKYGSGSVHSWVMPWSAECFSLAYNADLLAATEHVASSYTVGSDITVGGKWTRTPETVEELLAYFVDVEAGNAGISDENKKIVPFGWCYDASNVNHLEFIVNVWWAQIQGTKTSKIDGQGSYYDFFNFNSLDLLNQKGIEMGFDTLRSLVLDKPGQAGAKYINSDIEDNLKGLDLARYNSNAANGRYAVWVAGDYFENEYIKTLGYEPTFTTKMMFVPNAKGADGNFTTEKITYARTDESFYVPKNATNKELAQEFLAFMCNEKELLNYTKKCGGMRPFAYNPLTLDASHSWTEFQKSFFNIYNGADEVIIEYPANITDATQISPVYLYNKTSVHFSMMNGFTAMFSDATKETPAATIIDNLKNNQTVTSVFARWKDEYKQYFDTLQ